MSSGKRTGPPLRLSAMRPTCWRDTSAARVKTGTVPNMLLDPSRRSALMASIHSKNTKPELIAFRELKRRGLRFQRHYDNAPGKPDIAKPRKKIAVFVDGDFWHGRELDRVLSKYGEESTWAIKLRRNIARDLHQDELLRARGWIVLRVWESDIRRIRTREQTIDTMEAFLRSRD
jgi:DNA mismatch endonuclease (patch repair protein)